MDSLSLYLYAELEDVEECSNLRMERRLIRCGSSPLDITNNEIKGDFALRTSSGIPPILKLAATFRFLVEGSYQKSVGQDCLIGMAQPTVSKYLHETLQILERKMCPEMITFHMSELEKSDAKEHFYHSSGFPGVIMCVDGTHVSIIRPVKNEHHFFNRKGNHSLNVMMACTYTTRITCVNACHGGSAHDSVIWSMSAERDLMKSNFDNGDRSKMLGDSGYTLEPWMMTPYRSPNPNSRQAKYNMVHSKCRSVIERCFGILKSRFRCLLNARELHYEPEKAARIVNVCSMLHNVCLKYNVRFEEQLFVVNSDNFNTNDFSNISNQNIANAIRDQIRDSL